MTALIRVVTVKLPCPGGCKRKVEALATVRACHECRAADRRRRRSAGLRGKCSSCHRAVKYTGRGRPSEYCPHRGCWSHSVVWTRKRPARADRLLVDEKSVRDLGTISRDPDKVAAPAAPTSHDRKKSAPGSRTLSRSSGGDDWEKIPDSEAEDLF